MPSRNLDRDFSVCLTPDRPQGQEGSPPGLCSGAVATWFESDDGEAGGCFPVGSSAAVEAPGIEPGSRGTSVPASTCVACPLLGPIRRRPHVRSPGLRQARSPVRYRPGCLAGAAAEAGGVAPALRSLRARIGVRTATSRAKLAERLTGLYAARENCGSAVKL